MKHNSMIVTNNFANFEYLQAISKEGIFPCKRRFLDGFKKYCLSPETGSRRWRKERGLGQIPLLPGGLFLGRRTQTGPIKIPAA